jgi:hypothetical protein
MFGAACRSVFANRGQRIGSRVKHNTGGLATQELPHDFNQCIFLLRLQFPRPHQEIVQRIKKGLKTHKLKKGKKGYRQPHFLGLRKF